MNALPHAYYQPWEHLDSRGYSSMPANYMPFFNIWRRETDVGKQNGIITRNSLVLVRQATAAAIACRL